MSDPAAWPQVSNLTGRVAGEPRVLIVRLSAVGDCVQTMPLASAIRAQWPTAHLTWVVESGSAALVQLHSAIDRVIVVPKGFVRQPRLLWRLSRELGQQRFDIAFDPQGLTKSGLVSWLSGARRRIGFARPAARELSPWLQTERVISRAVHRVDRYLELLAPLGIRKPRVDFGLLLPGDAHGKAKALLADARLSGGYVAINPGAGWDSKRWPVERFAELAVLLGERGVRSVVTWGGKQELAMAEAIVAGSRGAAMLAPPTSLVELAAVLMQSRLFVGSDTGPLHLAAAVGTPCVVMFGASSAAACGPYGASHITIQRAHDESATRKAKGADNWAMRRIDTAAVFEACLNVLSRGKQSAAASRTRRNNPVARPSRP
jgi:lipopolysaccharide heptosyltransferase I